MYDIITLYDSKRKDVVSPVSRYAYMPSRVAVVVQYSHVHCYIYYHHQLLACRTAPRPRPGGGTGATTEGCIPSRDTVPSVTRTPENQSNVPLE